MILNTTINPGFITSEKLSKISGVKHFFSTRIKGDYASVLEDVNIGNEAGNINKLMKAAGFENHKIVYLKQVHGDTFHLIDDNNFINKIGLQGDAMITSSKSIAIGVFTADCVPVLLVDKKQGITAAVHAGWKGTRLMITAKVVNYMVEELGSKPGDIYAAIGPSIGSCCFEVGKEVFDLFTFKTIINQKFYVDLKKENINQLCNLGVEAQNIDGESLCTMCNDQLFHSYRRDQEHSGRQASFIQLL